MEQVSLDVVMLLLLLVTFLVVMLADGNGTTHHLHQELNIIWPNPKNQSIMSYLLLTLVMVMTIDHFITSMDQFDKSEESIDAPFQRKWNIINQGGGAVLLLLKNSLRRANYM